MEHRTADELTNAWKKGAEGDGGEEEDALRFRVFLDPAPGADAHAHAALLDDVARVLAAFVAARAERYLWHREPLTIERAARRPPGEEAHLAGEVRYGGNVEDEWLGVWLLLELTAAFPALGVTAEDAQDGQLLLIEAAHVLPDWLSPETAGNRVLLRGGHVLLASPEHAPETAGDGASLAAVLAGARAGTVRAHAPITEAVRARLQGYPGAALALATHRKRLVLPLPAARALAAAPWLVSRAVDALCARDALSMRAAAKMERLAPKVHPSVRVSVRLSRFHYAQLCSQRLTPPRAAGFELPPPSHPAHERAALSAKLVVGLEMLLSDEAAAEARAAKRRPPASRATKAAQAAAVEAEALQLDASRVTACARALRGASAAVAADTAAEEEAMGAMIAAWSRAQLPVGPLEGEERPLGALPSARAAFEAAQLMGPAHSDARGQGSVEGQGAEGVASWAKLAAHLPPAAEGRAAGGDAESDDDGWMALDPTDLDQLMAERAGQLPDQLRAAAASSAAGEAGGEADPVAQLMEGLSAFMAGSSGVDGVEAFEAASAQQAARSGAGEGGQEAGASWAKKGFLHPPGSKGQAGKPAGTPAGPALPAREPTPGRGTAGAARAEESPFSPVELDSARIALLLEQLGASGGVPAGARGLGEEEEGSSSGVDSGDDENDDESGEEGGGEGGGGGGAAELRELMAAMDSELDCSVAQPRAGAQPASGGARAAGAQAGYAQAQPRRKAAPELELEVATNMLAALEVEGGMAGPASSLLASLGIVLPPNEGARGSGSGTDPFSLDE
ncbi:SGT1 protein-domain-containing protein [Pavlovales sp. CCMP2436]|nr:SGT1 protein-domain-containing protein [Pavlovales sp. CCMP2436]